MKILSKVFVEDHELADAQCGEKERNRKAGGIDGEEQDAARDGVAASGKNEHGAEDRADARRPAESEGEAEEEAAPDAGLRGLGAEVDVAIEPARERRAEESNDGERGVNRSLRASSSRPTTCSGDMYPSLPLSCPASVRRSISAARAMPKSVSFTAPERSMSTLPGRDVAVHEGERLALVVARVVREAPASAMADARTTGKKKQVSVADTNK